MATIVASLRSILGTAVLALAAVGLSAWGLWEYSRRTGPRGADPAVVEICRAAYKRALTATDSSIVDRQRHVLSRVQAPNARTCGQLRHDSVFSHAKR
jgi:hypothetical protein